MILHIIKAFYFTECEAQPAIVFRSYGLWVALSCKEYVVAQGATREAAERALSWVIQAYATLDTLLSERCFERRTEGLQNIRTIQSEVLPKGLSNASKKKIRGMSKRFRESGGEVYYPACLLVRPLEKEALND